MFEGGIRVPGILVWPDKVPEKLETEKILNYGLTQLLHQILEDPKLAEFLTS